MKVSNETKVGALTAVSITVLILGFNFLKGKNITERSNTIYAVFPNVDGLAISSPVYANGYQIGRVGDLEAKDKNLSGIIVTITLTKDINIPTNSFASSDKTLLGTTSVKITLGTSPKYINEGDTLQVILSPDMMSSVKSTLTPAVDNINKTLIALEAVIMKLNSVIDPNTKNNIQSIVANLNTSSQRLMDLLNTQNGSLAKTLNHVESITGNLEKNNGKIDSSLSNVQSYQTVSRCRDSPDYRNHEEDYGPTGADHRQGE